MLYKLNSRETIPNLSGCDSKELYDMTDEQGPK